MADEQIQAVIIQTLEETPRGACSREQSPGSLLSLGLASAASPPTHDSLSSTVSVGLPL